MSKPKKVRANQSFSGGTANGDRMITGGTVLPADDPIVAAFPGMFDALIEVIPEPLTPPPARKAAPPRQPKGKANG